MTGAIRGVMPGLSATVTQLLPEASLAFFGSKFWQVLSTDRGQLFLIDIHWDSWREGRGVTEWSETFVYIMG